ncbi:MAG: hypothetical protein UV34_C0009G0010 [Parcubacteria group bacterium GW2011_GWB1_42_6]|nr:MAG: hypothetical protein UV34_C0009G0010 [Parcubacteria group bacterium GW2011_GWB1_42_6]
MAISLNNMGSGGAEGGWIMIFGIPIIIELSIFFSVIIDLIFAFLKKSMMFFAGALLALLIPFLLNFIFSGPFWGPFNWIFMIIDKVLQF